MKMNFDTYSLYYEVNYVQYQVDACKDSKLVLNSLLCL